MAQRTLDRIEEAFGWNGFPDGLFYRADHALRFDLAGDIEASTLRFMRAMERARAILLELLSGSETLTAVVTHYAGEKRTSRDVASLKKLAEIGFLAPFGPPDRVFQKDEVHISAFAEDPCRYWYSADFQNTEDQISALLWAALAHDLSITPKARWIDSIYIVDFERKLIGFPYDDRGLDVAAADSAPLRPLYEKRNGWLLDYDREIMDAKFR